MELDVKIKTLCEKLILNEIILLVLKTFKTYTLKLLKQKFKL